MPLLAPGTGNITGTDAIAIQRHFLVLGTPLSGCRLMAADVNGIGGVDGIDAIATQRFFLGLTSGIANVGKYKFTPVNRSYTGIVTNQPAQDYDALVFGDVTGLFQHRDGDPSPDAANDGGAIDAAAVPQGTPLITVTLPIDTMDNSVPAATIIVKPVTTTLIDPTTTAGINYIGFQGDFTFDTTVVSFPATGQVQKAGLTGGDWNVSSNILNTGPGTLKTLRISAFSNDFTPLNGSGTLFNLRMLRISNNPGDMSPLIWATAPQNFIYIDDNLESHAPNQPSGLITITGPAVTPTPTPIVPTPTPTPIVPTPTPTPIVPTPTPTPIVPTPTPTPNAANTDAGAANTDANADRADTDTDTGAANTNAGAANTNAGAANTNAGAANTDAGAANTNAGAANTNAATDNANTATDTDRQHRHR